MSISDSDRRRSARRDRTVPSRYDLPLAIIPATFLLALVASTASDVSPTAAFAGASLASTLALVDALFVNPPLGGER